MGVTTDHVIMAGIRSDWRDRSTNLTNHQVEEVNSRIREFGDVSLISVSSDGFTYRTTVPSSIMTTAMIDALYGVWHMEQGSAYYTLPVHLVTTDPETYAELARRAGVSADSNILINHLTSMFTQFDETGPTGTHWVDFVPFVFSPMTMAIELTDFDGSESAQKLEIHGVLTRDELPNEVWGTVSGSNNVIILVPELTAELNSWFATPAYDLDNFELHMRTIIEDMFATVQSEAESRGGDVSLGMNFINWQREADSVASTARLLMVFIYGFVALLIVIGLTNIISTVSTNIYARSREFAMLKSVGMDARGLRRILNFESIFCSAKALIIGLPIGLLASWLIHRVIDETVMFAYEVPWLAVLQCVVGVFVITWVVTRFSARKLRGQNIVETIRMESGM